jgi:hypothetical protein
MTVMECFMDNTAYPPTVEDIVRRRVNSKYPHLSHAQREGLVTRQLAYMEAQAEPKPGMVEKFIGRCKTLIFRKE